MVYLVWTVTRLASAFVPVSRPATRPTGLCSYRFPELIKRFTAVHYKLTGGHFGFEPLLRIWAYANHSFTRIERGAASAAALYR
jgi:hypothetical protein